MIETTNTLLNSYGLAGLIITVLAGVVVYLYRQLQSKDKRYDDVQEKRLQEAKDTSAQLTGPVEEQRKISEKMYEILVNLKDRRDL